MNKIYLILNITLPSLPKLRLEGDENEKVFHLVSYWWFRKTQYIPELGVDYNNRGFYLEGV
jgi:hypothetical protein